MLNRTGYTFDLYEQRSLHRSHQPIKCPYKCWTKLHQKIALNSLGATFLWPEHHWEVIRRREYNGIRPAKSAASSFNVIEAARPDWVYNLDSLTTSCWFTRDPWSCDKLTVHVVESFRRPNSKHGGSKPKDPNRSRG